MDILSSPTDTRAATCPTRPDESPWWHDPSAARHLHMAQAQGATLTTCSALWPDHATVVEEGGCDPWLLEVTLRPSIAVVYTTEVGHWRPVVDSITLEMDRERDIDAVVAATTAIERAARLASDLNKLVARQQRQNLQALISDQIAEHMATVGLSNSEMAAALSITPGVFSMRMNGSSPWTAIDMLRLYRSAGDDRAEMITRLFDAVEEVWVR